MSANFRMEGLAAFLAGAGLGAALARRLPGSGWGFPGGEWGNLSGTGRAVPVAASLGRMQALLGEIRGLLGPQSGGTERPGGAGGETRAAPETGGPPANPAGGDAWRIPDRIGYGASGGARDPAGALALCAASAGAAAAYAAIRKSGAAAAWPALAGFLASVAWAALGGRMRATVSGRRGPPAPMRGPKGSRSGRPAMP